MISNAGGMPRSLKSRLVAASAVALLALAAVASSAQAAGRGVCGYVGAEPVFSPWGDTNGYVLAPDGGFESGGVGWQLTGGAGVVAGNESYYLNAASDDSSLSLSGGSSATSPSVCVGLDTPAFRMLVRNQGDPSSRLRVSSVYDLPGRRDISISRRIVAGPSWQPTPQLATVLGLSLLSGSMQIRLAPLDSSGQWQVDDVYVDPFARH